MIQLAAGISFKSIDCCPVGMQNSVARFTIQTVSRYDTGVNFSLKKSIRNWMNVSVATMAGWTRQSKQNSILPIWATYNGGRLSQFADSAE